MDIQHAMARDLTDTVGAAHVLAERFGRSYSVDSLHQLVKQNKLRAFMFQDGVLTERIPGVSTRGKDLLFLYADLHDVNLPNRPGRPAMAK